MDIQSEPRRLYRSQTEKRIAGVMGGVAEYFHSDPAWPRLAFVIFFLLFMALGGFFLAFILFSSLYGFAWFMIPAAPQPVATLSLNKNS